MEKIEDEVKHIFREHHREADHWANLAGDGDEGRHREQRSNSEEWKAVRGFQDGSKRKAGGSGRGIVINGVDREK